MRGETFASGVRGGGTGRKGAGDSGGTINQSVNVPLPREEELKREQTQKKKIKKRGRQIVPATELEPRNKQ